MKFRQAMEIIGSLSFPTKLPGSAYGLPARACRIGSKLAKVSGTVCSGCYALKGRYGTTNVTKAQHRRLRAITHPRWADAMVIALEKAHRRPFFRVDMGVRNAKERGIERFKMNEAGWHRWHDSGDLQSQGHLSAICEIAARMPWIRFWLPTLELTMVMEWRKEHGDFPENLTVRISSPLVDQHAKSAGWPVTSSVFATKAPDGAHVCPAPKQDHQCMNCRACWSREVGHVAYAQH